MATLGKTLPHTHAPVLPLRLLGGKQTALKFRDEVLLALDTLRKNSLRSALTGSCRAASPCSTTRFRVRQDQ